MLQIKSYKNSEDSEWLNMIGSQAKGLSLVKSGNFAADILKFEPKQQTSLHTHPGDHILFIIEGDGWLDYNDEIHNLTCGTCYFVDGKTPHRVRASDSGMLLLSIANNHFPVDSINRLEVIND